MCVHNIQTPYRFLKHSSWFRWETLIYKWPAALLAEFSKVPQSRKDRAAPLKDTLQDKSMLAMSVELGRAANSNLCCHWLPLAWRWWNIACRNGALPLNHLNPTPTWWPFWAILSSNQTVTTRVKSTQHAHKNGNKFGTGIMESGTCICFTLCKFLCNLVLG